MLTIKFFVNLLILNVIDHEHFAVYSVSCFGWCLVGLLTLSVCPCVRPLQLLLHKSCLSIMNGANPMQTQQLLTFIKSARSVRKRKGQVATADSEDSISYEQAMAIVLTYKHLPGAFRLQEGGCLLQEAAAIFKKLGSHSGLRQCHALAAQ